MNISGKTILVPGATRGIGRTIAEAIDQRGGRLILPWHDDWPEDARSLDDRFGRDKKHLLLQADLRRTGDIQRLAETVQETFGSLDVLINNIERGGMPVIHGAYHRPINREQWQLEMETTLHAKWKLFEACLPLLRQSAGAAVINISSIAALTGRSGPAGVLFNDGYAAANRGIRSLTETWARMCAPTIRVNEIMLGFFDTRHGPGTRGWKELTQQQRRDLLDHTLLKRTGRPEEVVDALLYLLEGAEFMTGSVIRLDGGYLLGGEGVPPMPDGVI